jgi:hypothetical protein
VPAAGPARLGGRFLAWLVASEVSYYGYDSIGSEIPHQGLALDPEVAHTTCSLTALKKKESGGVFALRSSAC